LGIGKIRSDRSGFKPLGALQIDDKAVANARKEARQNRSGIQAAWSGGGRRWLRPAPSATGVGTASSRPSRERSPSRTGRVCSTWRFLMRGLFEKRLDARAAIAGQAYSRAWSLAAAPCGRWLAGPSVGESRRRRRRRDLPDPRGGRSAGRRPRRAPRRCCRRPPVVHVPRPRDTRSRSHIWSRRMRSQAA
jgi:hypothetical protein